MIMTSSHPDPIRRPPSEQLCDLHVYLLPRESWNEKYRSSYNESIAEALSAGFVRVWPELTLYDLRSVVGEDLGYDVLPLDFVFLKSVGRCMTEVKPKQEVEIKCKAFLPPAAWAPEIVVLGPPSNSPGNRAYPTNSDYSPRHNATQPVNGAPTHFPQLSNHDRTEPLDGQLPLVQQQTQKEDPLRRIPGVPGKSGRPDAYTNNTNEDSGIAEPTPEEYDPEFERRQSGAENQYYTGEGNFLQNQQRNKQLEEEAQRYEEERKQEEQRQREEEERQEAIQREERRRIEEEKKEEERREEEKRMEEKRREAERRVEEERREELRKREEENRRKQFEEERRKEEARIKAEKKREEEEKARRLEEQRMEEERREEEEERLRQEEIERSFEEQRQRKVAERIHAEKERAKAMLYDEDDVAMETDLAEDYGGAAPNDTQMRKRAEDELRDYQPQSSWGYKPSGRGGSVAREDADFEVKSQEEVRDGLKRVHLTPELERRAKVGKVQNRSISEDIYETDPAMAQLIAELEAARQERQDKEKEREALIKKAKNLQAKTHDRRYKSYDEPGSWSNSVSPDKDAQPRDYWKKRYFDEKKMTAPLEDQVNRLRNQAEVLHRKLLNHLEGKKGKGVPKVKGPPSKKNDHKITILKMQHELEELRRQAENAKMKLTSEVKLRNQAETEVRSLKSEVTQRKINLTLTRNQKLAALKGGDKLLAKTPIPSVGQGSTSVSAKR